MISRKNETARSENPKPSAPWTAAATRVTTASWTSASGSGVPMDDLHPYSESRGGVISPDRTDRRLRKRIEAMTTNDLVNAITPGLTGAQATKCNRDLQGIGRQQGMYLSTYNREHLFK